MALGGSMERSLKLLIAFCAAGILGLAFFAQAIGSTATAPIKAEAGSLQALPAAEVGLLVE